MRFSITNALLAFAIHSSIVSGRALPQNLEDCQKSLHLCSGRAPESLLQLRAPPPPKFGDGAGDGDGDGAGTDTSTGSDSDTGNGDTEGPITGNRPDTDTGNGDTEGPITGNRPDTTTPGDSPHDSTGDTPPPRDPNQAIGVQNPRFTETQNTYREVIAYLASPRGADDPTPRLPEDKGFLWSIHDEDGDGLSVVATDWAEKENYVPVDVLNGMPGSQADNLNNDIFDEYMKISSAGFARSLKGEVQMVADAKGLGPDTVLANYEWPEMMDSGLVTAIRWRDSSVQDFAQSKIIWTIDQGRIPAPIEGTQRLDELSGSHQ